MADYARYFKDKLLSDCNIIISWPSENGSSGVQHQGTSGQVTGTPRSSRSLPGHQLVLFKSSIFEAQARRWQTNETALLSQFGGLAVSSNKRTISLSIDSETQLPAAEAVIAAMYGVENCFSSLPHDQLVHALVLADMLDTPGLVQQIMAVLKAACSAAAGLSRVGQKAMGDLSAWPACLHQLLPYFLNHPTIQKHLAAFVEKPKSELDDSSRLIQRILLSPFKNLQAVWQDSAMSSMLMKLPLPAMQLLLSSDELAVPSEDIVLYTAQQYLKNQPDSVANTSKVALGGLIRAPYLSDFSLQLAAFSKWKSGYIQMFASQYQLRCLMSLKRLESFYLEPDLKDFDGAPESWKRGPRQLMPEQHMSVVWRLPVEQLAAECKMAATQSNTSYLHGPESPPFGGLSWCLHLLCSGQEGRTTVGLCAGPCDPIPDMGLYYKFQCSVTCNNQPAHLLTSDCMDGVKAAGFGWSDYWGVGPMSGGWDAVAWAAKGLPTTGELVLELKMLKVW